MDNLEESMTNLLRSLWSDESGQDLVEYVLILVLIALAAVAALQFLGGEVNQALSDAGTQLQSAGS